MNGSAAKIASLGLALAIVAVIGARIDGRAETKFARPAGSMDATETKQAKIERAMSAGPREIAQSAKIIDKDAQGHTLVLREGDNGFTCMPGNPNVIGDPAMCADGPSMQWAAAFAAHKPRPTKPSSRDHVYARRRHAAQ